MCRWIPKKKSIDSPFSHLIWEWLTIRCTNTVTPIWKIKKINTRRPWKIDKSISSTVLTDLTYCTRIHITSTHILGHSGTANLNLFWLPRGYWEIPLSLGYLVALCSRLNRDCKWTKTTVLSYSGYIMWVSVATALESQLICLIVSFIRSHIHKYKLLWFEGIQTPKVNF